jgi:hypothetical protein
VSSRGFSPLSVILIAAAALFAVLPLSSCKPDLLNEAINRTLEVPAPVFSVEGGTYPSDISVEIFCELEGSVIRYTLDGSEPAADSEVYAGPIVLAGDGTEVTLRAAAMKEEMRNSPVTTAKYEIEYAEIVSPEFSLAGGTYNEDLEIGLTCATDGVSIYYTTNGTLPDTEASEFTPDNPIRVQGHGAFTNIIAFAHKEGMEASRFTGAQYVINYYQAVAPVFTPAGGDYTAARDVTITTNTANATIYYTTDGRAPAADDYDGAGAAPLVVHVDTDMTVKAIATGEMKLDSGISTAMYEMVPDITVGEWGGADFTAVYAVGTYTADFGTVNTASGSVTIDFAVRNDGADDLQVDSVSIYGTDKENYTPSVPGGTPFTLSAGGAQTFSIEFDPIEYGLLDAVYIHINSDDPDESPFRFDLTGFGRGDTIYVDDSGAPGNNGFETGSPLDSIQAGIDLAVQAGLDEVLIAEGTYSERVTIAEGVSIRGGYYNSFASVDPAARPSAVSDPAVTSPSYAVDVPSGVTAATTIEGLSVSGGSLSTNYGIQCDGSPVITNCPSINGGGGNASYGIAINGGSPVVSNCTINGGGGAGESLGMYVDGNAQINNNTIISGSGDNADAIAVFVRGGQPQIRNNTINDVQIVSGPDNAYGIFIQSGSPEIDGNYIWGSPRPTFRSAGSEAFAVFIQSNSEQRIFNNVLVGGNLNQNYGIFIDSVPELWVVNNTIDAGTYGDCIGIYFQNSDDNGHIDNNLIFSSVVTDAIGIQEYESNSYLPYIRNNNFFDLDVLYRDNDASQPDSGSINSLSGSVSGNISIDVSGYLDSADYSLDSGTPNDVHAGGIDGGPSGENWGFTWDKNGASRTGNGTTGWSLGAYESDS